MGLVCLVGFSGDLADLGINNRRHNLVNKGIEVRIKVSMTDVTGRLVIRHRGITAVLQDGVRLECSA